LEGHTKDQGEIAYIGYGKGDDTIITVAWDRKIKVHKDERVAETLQSLGQDTEAIDDSSNATFSGLPSSSLKSRDKSGDKRSKKGKA